jgi:hypothetical protein
MFLGQQNKSQIRKSLTIQQQLPNHILTLNKSQMTLYNLPIIDCEI